MSKKTPSPLGPLHSDSYKRHSYSTGTERPVAQKGFPSASGGAEAPKTVSQINREKKDQGK